MGTKVDNVCWGPPTRAPGGDMDVHRDTLNRCWVTPGETHGVGQERGYRPAVLAAVGGGGGG